MIDNPPAEATAPYCRLSQRSSVDDGERQDQNPSLATVDHKGLCLWRDHRAPQPTLAADRTRLVRSAARTLANGSSSGTSAFVGAEVCTVGGSCMMRATDLIDRAEKFSAEIDRDACVNFIRRVF